MLLTYGFFIENHTIVNEVKKLNAGLGPRGAVVKEFLGAYEAMDSAFNQHRQVRSPVVAFEIST